MVLHVYVICNKTYFWVKLDKKIMKESILFIKNWLNSEYDRSS